MQINDCDTGDDASLASSWAAIRYQPPCTPSPYAHNPCAGQEVKPNLPSGRATWAEWAPTHRGKFLLEKVLCGAVPPPPEDVDDTLARREWGFEPQYDLESALNDYLLPIIRKRYT